MMKLSDVDDLIDQIPDQDDYETNAFLMDLESALVSLKAENDAFIAEVAGMRDKWTPPAEVARLEARIKALEASVSKSVLRRLDAQLEED